MDIVGTEAVDILLDEDFQPVADIHGDVQLIDGDACWLQDLRMEAAAEENELFYEEDNDIENYGFGMRDFLHCEQEDDSLVTEIEARVKDKLAKRTYIDLMTVQVDVDIVEDELKMFIRLKKTDGKAEYNLDLTVDEVEVAAVYD